MSLISRSFLSTLLFALLVVPALSKEVTQEQFASRLASVEASLGPASGKVLISDFPQLKPNLSSARFHGDFIWEINGHKASWSRHIPAEEIRPMRGSRSTVFEVRPEGLLWYDVFDDNPNLPSIGNLTSKPGTISCPLIGRVLEGRWLSDVIVELSSFKAQTAGGFTTVDGKLGNRKIELRFDEAEGLIAQSGVLSYPDVPGMKISWMIDAFERVGNSVFPARATLDDIFPATVNHPFLDRVTTFEFSGFSKNLPRLPTPAEGTFVADDNSNTLILHSSGKLVFRNRKAAPQQRSIGWNLIFMISSAAVLMISLGWVVFSRKPS